MASLSGHTGSLCCYRADTVVVFHINAMTAEVVRKVQTELRCRVSAAPMVVPVVHDVIARLSAQVTADIARLESPHVHIDIGTVLCLTLLFSQWLCITTASEVTNTLWWDRGVVLHIVLRGECIRIFGGE